MLHYFQADITSDIDKHFHFLSEDKRVILFESLLELLKYDNLVSRRAEQHYRVGPSNHYLATAT